MRFGVLGPLAVWTSEGEPVPVPGAKVRALLAVLLLHDGRPVTAERLIYDLWGDQPPRRSPSGALSAKVSQLRRVFDEAEPGSRALVRSGPSGYQLLVAKEAGEHEPTVDAWRFEALAGRARGCDDARRRVELLSAALAVWRGPAFADFADEPFARPARARLGELRLTAVEDLAEARLDLGEHAVLVGELDELLARHPLRERLRASHMRALYGAGRQSEALDSYETLRVRLAEDLGLDPGRELVGLHQAIVTQDPSLTGLRAGLAAIRPLSNLPAPLVELIGRETAVDKVRRLTAAARLVTLTGSGGVGKTSLAVEVARQLTAAFPDGTWLVEFAGTSPDALYDEVLAALDVRESAADGPTGQLGEVLQNRRMLLVLDNCEHVVAAAADLADDLLRSAGGLTILATSREPLGVTGEVVWPVPPLELPEPDADEAALGRSSAARLFVARATDAEPGFRVDDARSVATLCRRLDGIPLALELAATRVRALGVPGLAARLDDRFRLLAAAGRRGAPQRQQTLTAMIDWSWDLLTDAERAVLRRLAVHADGCTLDAAEYLCGFDADSGDGDSGDGGASPVDVTEILVRLVDRSLVSVLRTPQGQRYRLLESVSAYCVDRLREAGELDQARQRHLRYYLALAEQARPALHGAEQRTWLQRLDAETANLRAAADYALLSGDVEPNADLRLVVSLSWYWFLRGRLTEARRLLAAALARHDGDGDGGSLVAEVTAWHTGFVRLQGGRSGGDGQLAALLGQVADAVARCRAQWFLAFTGLGQPKLAAHAGELLDAALAGARAAGDDWGVAAALTTRAMVAHISADLPALERDAAGSAEIFARLGDRWGQVRATEWLAAHAELAGDVARAYDLHLAGLRLAEELDLWPEVANRLCWLGWTAMQRGNHAGAAGYGARALSIATEQGHATTKVFAETVLAYAARRSGDLDAAEAHLHRLLATAKRDQGDDDRTANDDHAAFSERPADRILDADADIDVADDRRPALYLPMVLTELGFVAEQRSKIDRALAFHLGAFDAAARLDAMRDQTGALEGVASALASAGSHGAAAQLLGAAAAARAESSLPSDPAELVERERVAAACRAALGEVSFAAAVEKGRQLRPAEARLLAVRPGVAGRGPWSGARLEESRTS